MISIVPCIDVVTKGSRAQVAGVVILRCENIHLYNDGFSLCYYDRESGEPFGHVNGAHSCLGLRLMAIANTGLTDDEALDVQTHLGLSVKASTLLRQAWISRMFQYGTLASKRYRRAVMEYAMQ